MILVLVLFICQNEQLKDMHVTFYSRLYVYCDNPIFCLAIVSLYYFCHAYHVSSLLSDSINLIFTETKGVT